MNIIYKEGNLLDAPEVFIAHGCNAQGKFRSGVAGQIRDKYPLAYEKYMGMPKGLGQVGFVVIDNTRVIINCITQQYYGYDGKKYVSYEALEHAVDCINSMAKGSQLLRGHCGFPEAMTTVAFPLIGAGLAGGQWEMIANIIENRAVFFQPVVYKYVP